MSKEGIMGLESISMQNNIISLRTNNSLLRTERALGVTYQRLSSGLRINSAKDDAAGLAISERLRAQTRSLSQAQRNANDGISLLQTAEGALTEIDDMLIRMRELSVQAANGTLSSADRTALNSEFTALRSEIDRLATTTEFDGIDLINGGLSGAGVNMQVGTGGTSNDRINVTLSSAMSANIGISAGLSITTATNASNAIAPIDTALNNITRQRGTIGAFQNRLLSTVNALTSAHENLSAAQSRIADADIALEAASLARLQILMQSGISIMTQANQNPAMALTLLSA
jgi:flagellin